MKLNKIYFALFAMLSFIVTACSNSDNYDWATVSGNQVYFSNEGDSVIEISPSKASFEVPVYRVKTDEAITVPLKAVQEDNSIFTVPANVSFKAGEKVAKINISYDQTKIEYGKYEKMTLSIADANYSTDYGYGSYAFKAGVTQWSEWEPYNEAGTCTYSYSQYFSDDDTDVKLYIRHNTIETDLYQLYLENIMYGVDVILDYNKATGVVTCSPQSTGYTNSKYGEDVYFTDFNTYWEQIRGKTPGTDFDPVYGTFDEETGIIDIPLVYYISLGYFSYGYETITLDGYDRKDVSCSIEYTGKFVDTKNKTSLVANVTLGADVEKANVALVSGELTQEIFNQIKEGTYEGTVEVSESGEVRFDAENLEDGNYTLVVISYYGNEAQSYDTAEFKYSNNSTAEKWNVVGEGIYTYGVKVYTEKGVPFYEGKDQAVLYKSESDGTRYKIAPWGTSDNNDGLIFTMDAEGNIVVDHVETGDIDDTYGAVYATDFVTYEVAEAGGKYDSKYTDGVFNFYLAYHVSDGSFTYELNTFVLTDSNNAKAKVAKVGKNVKRTSGKKDIIRVLNKEMKPLFSVR